MAHLEFCSIEPVCERNYLKHVPIGYKVGSFVCKQDNVFNEYREFLYLSVLKFKNISNEQAY